VLGGKIGAVVAAFAGPGVAFLEVDLVVAAVVGPDLEDTLDVGLADPVAVEPVLLLEQLLEDGLVERLRAQQADVQHEAVADLADLARLGDRHDRALAAHADQRDLLRAGLHCLVVGERVGRVRVATARAPQYVVAVERHARRGRPLVALALADVRREGGVDVAMVECPDEDCRHEPAVLADLVDEVVGRPGQDDVLEHPRRLVGGAVAAEHEVVGLVFPRAEARAGTGATRAALLAMAAVFQPQFLFEVEWRKPALHMLVADDVVRAGDHAAGAAGAQPGGDDLVVQLLPLERPALRRTVGCGRGLGRFPGHCHVARLRQPSRQRTATTSQGDTIGLGPRSAETAVQGSRVARRDRG